jgi:hypothetical protein
MGGDVKLLQTKLNSKGYNLVADGILGNISSATLVDTNGYLSAILAAAKVAK